jgi:superfamily I DNA/RNA helicase/RecB family exonuclease
VSVAGASIRTMVSRLPLAPDPEQAGVLSLDRGSVLVTGPPGAGKSALLVERFARLVEGGADPERVLLMVLHRRAGRDARDQLVHRLARSVPDLPVHTVHAFAYRVLGRRFGDLGYTAPPQLLSAPEQYAAVRQLLTDERTEEWPRYGHLLTAPGFARQVADFLLRAQERLLDPGAVEDLAASSGRPEYLEAARFYQRYLDQLAAGDRTDFAGLLFQAATLLRRDLSDAEAYDHLLVDDYQDATPAAEAMVSVLSAAATSVVVAADPHGHVFSYQGGSLEPLGRLHEALGGLRRVDLSRSHRMGTAQAALPPLDDPAAPPGRGAQGIEASLFAHPGEEADAVAHELVRARVEEAVPWEEMAVILRRYGGYLTALRHALTRHGIPFVVVHEAAAVATEPANRPVIDLLRYVVRDESRDDLLERLLVTPLVGLDPHDVRRLRREARLSGRTLRGLVEDGDAPDDLRERVVRFRDLVRDIPREAEDRGPDGLFFWLWSSIQWFRDLVSAGDRQRDLDALAALGDVLARFVERRPGATVEDYLDTLDAAEFGPDPWIAPEERYPHAVRIVSAHRAHGMEVEVAVVVGCLEGEFPSLSVGEPLLDLPSLVFPRSPTERLRERLAEERALFRLAISRARRRTVLTASHSTSARNPRTPSRFASRIGLAWTPPPDAVPPAASLRTLEADLRRRVGDLAAPRPARLAALVALPRAGADPGGWWGGRDWTDPGEPLHPDDIRTSYSRFSVLENCALQYLYAVEMGLDPTRSHQMWVGTVIHDILDRVQRGEIPRDEDAMLAALDEAWRPEVFPNRALEHQRRLDAGKMLRVWLEDEGHGEVLMSEEAFSFRLDGAEIRGRIDAVFRFGDNALRVVDYKTSRSMPTQDEIQQSLQLGAYFLAMRKVPEFAELGEPRLLELAYIFHEASGGGYKRGNVKPDRMFDSLSEYGEWAEARILELLDAVRQERFAPNPEANCLWCSFKPICPVWPQGQEVAT